MATRTLAALFMAWVLTACSPSEGEAFISGKVVHVIDGNTLTLRVAGGQGDVRLADIQAPHRGQPLARRSQQSLSALCAGKKARVEFVGIDGDGPVIGRVWCNGVDVNAEQVRLGMARNARRGLWSDAAVVLPARTGRASVTLASHQN